MKPAFIADLNSDPLIIVYTTIGSEAEAKKLVSLLLEESLIVCANIMVAAESFYKEDDKIINTQESIIIIKTLASKEKLLREKMKAIHPYDTPCIITLTTHKTNSSYYQWACTQIKTTDMDDLES